MDDVLDLIDLLLAADTYDHAGKGLVRAAELLKNAGAGAFAKGSGPLGWGFRGADYLTDELGIELPPGVRAQLRAEAEQAKAGAFTGGVYLYDEAGDVAGARGQQATDHGPGAPVSDRIATGVFDP